MTALNDDEIHFSHASLSGALGKYANPSLIEREKEIAWEQVAEDKNALS